MNARTAEQFKVRSDEAVRVNDPVLLTQRIEAGGIPANFVDLENRRRLCTTKKRVGHGLVLRRIYCVEIRTMLNKVLM